jgi:hypothetical protein
MQAVPAAPPLLVVSVHDVAPASQEQSRAWADLLARFGVPLTYLAIPGPWRGAGLADEQAGAGLGAWLRDRQDAGDEVALHGWFHRADVRGPRRRELVGSMVARGAAEFWTLDRATSAERTARGLEVLDRHGLRAVGTTPPGWLASREAVQGFADAGLRYSTDHAGVVDLASGRRWRAPAVCHRPASAQTVRRSFTEEAGRRLVGGTWRSILLGRSVRIGLHPDDLGRPGLADVVVRAVERSLDAGALAVTYREVLDRMRAAER